MGLIQKAVGWALSQAPSMLPSILPPLLKAQGFTDQRTNQITEGIAKSFDHVRQYQGVSKDSMTDDAFSRIFRDLKFSRDEISRMYEMSRKPLYSAILDRVDPRVKQTLEKEMSLVDRMRGHEAGQASAQPSPNRGFATAADFPSLNK